MGNGVLPDGPTDRAHPPLYLSGHADTSAICPLSWAKRTSNAEEQRMRHVWCLKTTLVLNDEQLEIGSPKRLIFGFALGSRMGAGNSIHRALRERRNTSFVSS